MNLHESLSVGGMINIPLLCIGVVFFAVMVEVVLLKQSPIGGQIKSNVDGLIA